MGSIKALLSRDGLDWKEGGEVGRSVVEEALKLGERFCTNKSTSYRLDHWGSLHQSRGLQKAN
jgi:hypothetical protein